MEKDYMWERLATPAELDERDRDYHQQIQALERTIQAAPYYPEGLLDELAMVERARRANYDKLQRLGMRPADRIIDPPALG